MAEIKWIDIVRTIKEHFYEEDEQKFRDCQDVVFDMLKAMYGKPKGHVFEGDIETANIIANLCCTAYERGVMAARDKALGYCAVMDREKIRKAIMALY